MTSPNFDNTDKYLTIYISKHNITEPTKIVKMLIQGSYFNVQIPILDDQAHKKKSKSNDFIQDY